MLKSVVAGVDRVRCFKCCSIFLLLLPQRRGSGEMCDTGQYWRENPGTIMHYMLCFDSSNTIPLTSRLVIFQFKINSLFWSIFKTELYNLGKLQKTRKNLNAKEKINMVRISFVDDVIGRIKRSFGGQEKGRSTISCWKNYFSSSTLYSYRPHP